MKEFNPSAKLRKQNRRDEVYAAKEHIKSILVGLQKFENGSNVEGGYLMEKYDRLGYYINKIAQMQGYF